MMKSNNINLVAEIGCNHMGNFDLAIKMIDNAKNFCKADVVKFQKRSINLISKDSKNKEPHPNPINSFGENYEKHRKFLEFDIDQHIELKKFSDSIGIKYSTSVWDLESAEEVVSLKPEFIKVPSAMNLDFNILRFLCENYNGLIHLSLGMTTIDEKNEIINFFRKKNRMKDLILYSCTSGYPVKFDEIYLNEIIRLKENYDGEINSIGFSGHHLGIAIDMGAIVFGISWLERHFTLDRTWKGTDQVASLEPDGLRKLKRDSINIKNSLNYKPISMIKTEKETRQKLKKINRID